MTDLYNRPSLTYFLIAACIGVFLFEIFYSFQNAIFGASFEGSVGDLFNSLGFSLPNLLGGRYWTLLTSVFLHADLNHLLLNMIALFIFGRVVEMNMGRRKFLMVFIASAIVGNLAFSAFSLMTGSFNSVIGASGAIFGLIGIGMLIKPMEFVFYPYLIPIPLILVAALYTLYTIGSFILVAANLETSNISYIAHIGGLATGMIFGFREEKSKRGFLILLFLLAVFLLAPFIWTVFGYLENFNYISVISTLFG